jgi:hypothetical protein
MLFDQIYEFWLNSRQGLLSPGAVALTVVVVTVLAVVVDYIRMLLLRLKMVRRLLS